MLRVKDKADLTITPLCGKRRGKKIIGSLKRKRGKSAPMGGIDSVGIVRPNTVITGRPLDT